MKARDTVQVCVDMERLGSRARDTGGPVPMGTLHRQGTASGSLFSFAYEPSWLARPDAIAFDPDLARVTGAQYPRAGRATFGIFLDSSPDRWGRVLMQRRESSKARHEGRNPRTLNEWDFLLGVHDETRLGALRFRNAPEEPFLDADGSMAAPPITSLRELQAASLNFEEHLADEDHPSYERWLAQLFAPGSSLGGARPKATVKDEEGSLCMAKFPSRQDTRDIGAWELVAHRLAARAGITVPFARPMRLRGSSYTTFLVKRFDRSPRGGRLAFVSAMTLTQRTDGEEGASYLELVDLLQSMGASTQADCKQLFRRVVFSILIHNVDDHLRNHGFLIDEQGIRLSPAYDLNPSVERRHLSTAINEVETDCDVAIALAAARSYGLTRAAADAVVSEVRVAVSGWRKEARSLGIPKAEQDLMAEAFEP